MLRTLVVRSVEPRKERDIATFCESVATATDLADTLVREHGPVVSRCAPFVGAVVRSAAGRSLTADQIDAGLIRSRPSWCSDAQSKWRRRSWRVLWTPLEPFSSGACGALAIGHGRNARRARAAMG